MGCKWRLLADPFEPVLYVPWTDPDEEESQVITELSAVVGASPADIIKGAESGALKFWMPRQGGNLVISVAVSGETIYWERVCGMSPWVIFGGIGLIAVVGTVVLAVGKK
jgi:hypothetical protein